MKKLDPTPSVLELVKDNPTADYQWKTWLENMKLEVNKLLADKYNHVAIQNANFGKGTTAPSQVIIGDYTGWSFDISDDSVFNIEMPHDIDDSKDLGVHFTFVINEAYATNNGEVQFQVDYSCVPHIGGGETITSPGSSGTLTTGDIDIPATAYETYHDFSMTIPAADFTAGDLIGITFSRIAITAGNNPTADPVILNLHLEYTRKSTDWYDPT